MPDLHLLADENIPLAREAFSTLGRVRLLPGRAITAADVREADALLVRSVTRVDAALVDGSQLRFVGSATIGTDHIDEAALRARDIAFAHAPGSNAESVVEYVLAALLRLATRRGEALRGKTVGIVGCGNVGGRLAARLPALGLRVLTNDPPLAERAGASHDFVSLNAILTEADIVTLHVPLTRDGPHPTYHLFDTSILHRLRPTAWLINTARGAVVDNDALARALADGVPAATVLDVWESEPTPDPALLHRAALATPHVAGYSYDGKVQGTIMLYQALTAHLGVLASWDAADALAPGPDDHLVLTPPDPALPETSWLDALVYQLYDIEADDARLRRLLDLPQNEHAATFSRLRKTYPRRRSFARHTLLRRTVPETYHHAVERGLRVRLAEG